MFHLTQVFLNFLFFYLKCHKLLNTKTSTGTLITIQYSFYSYITLQDTATLLKDIYYIYCIKKETFYLR